MDAKTPLGSEKSFRKLSAEFDTIVGPEIDKLCAIAAVYEKPGTTKGHAAQLKALRHELKADTFKVLVVGRFKTGKSTLLNALLGRPLHRVSELPKGGAPLPTSDLPCTPVLTRIYHSDCPEIFLQRKGSKQWEEKTLQWFFEQARVRAGNAHEQAFGDVLQFKLGFPTQFCQESVTLIDSPGTDEDPEREAIANEALASCDAAIVVYRSDVLEGMEEIKYVQKMRRLGIKQYFSVVNLFDNQEVDEELKEVAWQQIVTKLLGGPPYEGQNFHDRRIYFVNAKIALDGKLAQKSQLVKKSGLATFEHDLLHFLKTEKMHIHRERFIEGARNEAAQIEKLIKDSLPSTQMSAAQFQLAEQEIQPKLEALRKLPDRLNSIFKAHKEHANHKLQLSFQQLIDQIRRDLPQELNKKKLPSFHTDSFLKNLAARTFSAFQKKKLSEEAVTIAKEIINERVETWATEGSSAGAQKIVDDIKDKLVNEVIQEVAKIARGYEAIRLQLRGWSPAAIEVKVKGPGWAERIVAGAIGVALGQLDFVIAGGAGGFRSLGRYALGSIVITVPLALLGAPLLPIIVPAGIIAGLLTNSIWESNDIEKSIKKEVARLLIDGDYTKDIEGLRGEPERVRPYLKNAVEKTFFDLEQQMGEKVNQYIQDEEQSLAALRKSFMLESNEKERLLQQMRGHLKEIEACKTTLQNAIVTANQEQLSSQTAL